MKAMMAPDRSPLRSSRRVSLAVIAPSKARRILQGESPCRGRFRKETLVRVSHPTGCVHDTFVRHESEHNRGTGCGKTARPGLCGGRPVTRSYHEKASMTERENLIRIWQ